MNRVTSFSPLLNRASMMRFLASLAAAALLWAFVTTIGDPEQSRVFASVPVQPIGITNDLTVVTDLGTTEVRVTGPESVVDALDVADIRAVVDLSEVQSSGTYSLPVRIEAPDDLWKTTSDRTSASVGVEAVVVQSFPLEVEVLDIDATSLRSVDVTPEVDDVTVTGPDSNIARIARVVLPVESSGGSRMYSAVFVPEARDEFGDVVPDVTINPSALQADVTISSRGKSVAVLVTTAGAPAPGFDVLDRTSNPTTVIVDGPEEVIRQIIAVSTESVDISGADSSVTAEVRLVGLPEGVIVIQPIDGLVDVLVQIGQRGVSQTLANVPVTATNVGSGLVATFEPAGVSIDIDASQDVIASLTGDDVEAFVSLEGLDVGTYTIEPVIVVPPGVKWTAVNPGSIDVTISREEENASPTAGN